MRIFFAWYDCWIGWYFDRRTRALYICPLPMLVIQIGPPVEPCHMCCRPGKPCPCDAFCECACGEAALQKAREAAR